MLTAEEIDTNDKTGRAPKWTVHQAEISPPPPDDSNDHDDSLDSFQIKMSELQTLLDTGCDANTVLKVFNVIQKRLQYTPNPAADIPSEIYNKGLSPEFKKQLNGLSCDEHVNILQGNNKLKNPDLTAKLASVEQDLRNVQARLANLDLQAYASCTTTFGELQANQAHQVAIKAHTANLNKTQKIPANLVHPGSIIGLLASSTQGGITPSTVITNNRSNSSTEVGSVTLNQFQIHPCLKLDDDSPTVDVNMAIHDGEYDNTVTYRVSKQEFSCII